MKRVRVCMVAYTDYIFDARVRREAETLVSNGFDVLCVKVRNGSEPRRSVVNGVHLRELNIPKYQGKSALAYLRSYLYFLIGASAVCVGLLLKGELDVVHVHNLPDFLVLAGLVPRMAGRKVVLDIHDSVPETFATKFSGRSMFWQALCLEERFSALLANKVICVNHPQRDTLVARGIPRRKTVVSMNVPDPEIFKSGGRRTRHWDTESDFNVVYHGTMADRLGVDLAIRAVAAVRTRIPKIRLHLWGRGDDLPQLYRLAEELGLQDAVDFRPEGFPLEELPQRLQSMDVGVVGNRRSAATELMLPVKLMEYVSLGIPVVAPRLKTIAHYFSDDMVAFYEPEDVHSFADSIYRLWQQHELRCTQSERAGAFMTQYGWERQGPELVTFYRDLVESKSI